MKVDLEKMAPNMKATERLSDVQAGLEDAEREAEDARKDSRLAKDTFQDLRKKRCDLFNKAYSHMSDHIDKIYKNLTKSKAFPDGGVAFLSLEDADVRPTHEQGLDAHTAGTVPQWGAIQCHAAWQAIRRNGAALWGREDYGGVGTTVQHSQASARSNPSHIR